MRGGAVTEPVMGRGWVEYRVGRVVVVVVVVGGGRGGSKG